MKILMLLEGEFPPDERVEKEIQTLTEHGHELEIACSTRTNKPGLEKPEGFTIHRIRISDFMYKMSALFLVFPLYKRMWYKFTLSVFANGNFDVIHVHDLPLSSIGMKLKRKFGIKLICDQHEYYSNWIVDTAHYNTFFGKIVKLLSNWKKYERKALNSADHIITVEEPLKQVYIDEYQLESEKISVLPNTPSKFLFQSATVDPNRFSQYEKNFTLLYFGGIDILRGLEYIINAIPEIVKIIPNFKYVIAGPVRGDYDPLRIVKRLGVEKYVDYIGWIDRKDLPSLIHISDLGVHTPVSERAEVNKTIATKIYQLLVMNKPMMVGRAKYMKEFVEEQNIGFSVDESQASEVARKIIAYYQDIEKRNKMIENCKKVGPNHYWENTSISLVECYNSILK